MPLVSCTDIEISDTNGTYEACITYCMPPHFSLPVYVVRTKNPEQEHGRLFISTINPASLPKITLEMPGLWRILEYCEQRWKIETYLCEIKIFWSLVTIKYAMLEKLKG